MKKGFTLIEVLTVVLIIAVLTAVAMPQYRRVVERSYATEAITTLRVLYDSSERLAAEFGARNYQSLGMQKGDISRLDIMDTSDSTGYPFRCNITSRNIDSNVEFSMECPKDDPRWNYILQHKTFGMGSGSSNMTKGGRYIIAQRASNKYEGTQIVFDRTTEDIFCVPNETDREARACDVYNIDVGVIED